MCFMALILTCPNCGTKSEYITIASWKLDPRDKEALIDEQTKLFHCSTCGYEKYVSRDLLGHELEKEFSVMARFVP